MAKKTWRDVLPVHPASELLPMMTDDELAELGADIEAHGLQAEPSTVTVGTKTVPAHEPKAKPAAAQTSGSMFASWVAAKAAGVEQTARELEEDR